MTTKYKEKRTFIRHRCEIKALIVKDIKIEDWFCFTKRDSYTQIYGKITDISFKGVRFEISDLKDNKLKVGDLVIISIIDERIIDVNIMFSGLIRFINLSDKNIGIQIINFQFEKSQKKFNKIVLSFAAHFNEDTRCIDSEYKCIPVCVLYKTCPVKFSIQSPIG